MSVHVRNVYMYVTYMYDLHATTATRDNAHAASRYGTLRRCRWRADVHANGTRMHNRGVCAFARVYYMYMAPHCGCVRCGRQDADYAAQVRLQLVL